MPKLFFGLPINVRADILCGVMRAAGDPDANTLQDWLVQGAPLGMDRRIETTGSFPVCGQARQLTVGWGHCRSVLENPEDAHKEFERYLAAQIAVDIDKDTLERLFLKSHVNKLVARKGQIAPCRGCETFQSKRTSGSARAPDPASTG